MRNTVYPSPRCVCVCHGVILQPPSQEQGQRDRDGRDAPFERPMASGPIARQWKERPSAPMGRLEHPCHTLSCLPNPGTP